MKIHKEIYIHKDERNAILLTPDSFKGVNVQVIRFSIQLKPNYENKLVEQRVMYALWTKTIKTMPDNTVNDLMVNPLAPLKFKDGNKFKSEIKKTIEEAKSYLSKIQGLDKMIDGSMNDYFSQNQELNKVD